MPSDGRHEPVPAIAIIGHGCVLPGALGPAELWQAVVEGRDLLRPVPPGVWRVDTAKALSPQAPERSATDRGGYVQGFDAIFDPNGFACPAEELGGLDPLVLWLVHSGREALREAGLDIAQRGRCGLIAGNLSYPTASLSAYAESVWLDREGPKPANRFSSGPAGAAGRPCPWPSGAGLLPGCRLRVLALCRQAGLRPVA
nr:beta-ketoacyl synthase N-terminal-like domain-containing protein [Azospirillum sp. INR13]